MVKQSLDDVFAALADPTRRAIVAQLAAGDASVSELARPFDMTLPAVAKHVRVLEQAGLLKTEKEGRVRSCHLVAEPMQEVLRWIAQHGQFWEDQLESLDALLSESRQPAKR
jgi:DNA-binding transcriptional ArsR family regulator